MKKSTIAAVLLYTALALAATKINAQDSNNTRPKPVTLPARTGRTAELKINSQGFQIPASCPDSTLVYQVGTKGSLFVWKTSKKTGQKYKYYLPKEK